MYRSIMLVLASVTVSIYAPLARATFTMNFESPTYSVGDLNGQNGWNAIGSSVVAKPSFLPAQYGSQSALLDASDYTNPSVSLAGAGFTNLTSFNATLGFDFTAGEPGGGGTWFSAIRLNADGGGGQSQWAYLGGVQRFAGSYYLYTTSASGEIDHLITPPASQVAYAMSATIDFTNHTQDVIFTNALTGTQIWDTGPQPLINSAVTLAQANATAAMQVFVYPFGDPPTGLNTYLDNVSISPAAAQVPGDLNGDGLVNLTDYGILKTNWLHTGTGLSGGDLNFDGKVDISDFGLFKHDYDVFNGIGGGSDGLGTSVPEPGSLVLMGAALPALYFLRRRRRRPI